MGSPGVAFREIRDSEREAASSSAGNLRARPGPRRPWSIYALWATKPAGVRLRTR